jgi:hypothetical protein
MRTFNIVLLILSAFTCNVDHALGLSIAEVKNARGTNLIAKGNVVPTTLKLKRLTKTKAENNYLNINISRQ